ncbi:MAG: phosphotriesterase [Candidatus Binatia bacterium]
MPTTTTIQTVTGPIAVSDLGRTLMHEHMLIGYPGWESDTLRPGPARSEMVSMCSDRIDEMRAHGVTTMVDPCPNDLGRDVEFAAEMSARTGFRVICATGLYKENEGGAPYWKFRANFGAHPDSIAEVFIRELTVGIGQTGIRAGIIKVATGSPKISDYERMLLTAAAKASVETGAPITTHTDHGMLGDEQQRILVEAGVPAHRIIIGHSCGSADHDYHMNIVRGGSYLGFDRFGLGVLQPDDVRVSSLLAVLAKGAGSRVVVSHDSVWCWRGQPIPNSEDFLEMMSVWTPSHFFTGIVPKLLEGGATKEQIETMLVDNPRRFFAGDPPP